RRYWAIAIAGYFINLIAVPLLAFAGNWEIASVLIVAERFGKAIRTPARDTILSYASSSIGYGKGFGLHEAVDQIGAIIGPLFVAGAIYSSKSYSLAFLSLGIPAILSLLMLFMTVMTYPDSKALETRSASLSSNKLDKTFYLYLLFIMLTVCGYPHFQIISYHFKKIQIVSDEIISTLFAVAMAVDAVTALIIGGLFDRFRLRILFLIPFFAIPISIFAFVWGNLITVVVSVVLWGIVMGFHETVIKSAIAVIVPMEKRGLAYGIFHSLFGVAWFIGGLVIGRLYEISIFYLIVFSAGMQVLSLICFVWLKRAGKIF
ncbi:MAG: MFS transporter, partial [Candidatus Kryptonium sp.]